MRSDEKNGAKRAARAALRFLFQYFIFFILVAFVISCCTALFITTLSSTMDITLGEEDISAAAKITFWNVALLSLIFTIIDIIRRRLTVERPVRAILDAADRMVAGDFSVRVRSRNNPLRDDSFDRVTDCFNKMAQELQSVETLRTDFIANVSHEMKTPLAVIQNYGTLLQAPALDDEKRMEYAKGITDASRRTADMMTNILKLNRLENQQIYPNYTTYDLGEQLCECLLGYESVWEKKNIEIETDIADGVSISADAELVSLVWNNLLSNAFKFTPEGGRVCVTLHACDGYASVSVRDSGCGMTKEVGEHIFDKFYQGDTSHSSQGNGLGLALVKRVVDIVHADIDVSSTVGVGSTFTVRLPLLRAE